MKKKRKELGVEVIDQTLKSFDYEIEIKNPYAYYSFESEDAAVLAEVFLKKKPKNKNTFLYLKAALYDSENRPIDSSLEEIKSSFEVIKLYFFPLPEIPEKVKLYVTQEEL